MTVRHLGFGSRAAGWLCTAVLALAAAGCGGGGGGSGDPAPSFSDPPAAPPATAAAIGTTTTDAMDATRAAVATADGLVARQASMNGLAALLGQSVAGMESPVAAELVARVSRSPQAHPDRARILATTDPCTDYVDSPCTGTVTTDTNIANNATTINAGQFVEATFNNINGFLLGRAVTFSGKLRIEFLTGINAASGSFNGMGLRIKFTAFAGTVAGNAFGPISETVDLNISAQGVPTLVTGGVRYGTVAGVTSTGAGSYTIGSGTARLGYGAAVSGYVDVNLTNWRIGAARPLVNSTASITNGSVTVTVTVASSGASTVTYNVSIVSGGVTRTFTVTAQYASGTPTYTATATN